MSLPSVLLLDGLITSFTDEYTGAEKEEFLKIIQFVSNR